MTINRGQLRQALRAALWALTMTLGLAALIMIGSRNLAHFDAALVAYTFSILFATFGITYRYVVWLSRPPTAMYWRQGWRAVLRRGNVWANLFNGAQRLFSEVLANRFIFRRGRLRGLAHLLIMWGCLIAVAITFPLVFGWLHFRPVADDLSLYEAMLFGFPAFRFPHDSWVAFFLFHGLVWASFLVIAGVMLAMRRRMRDGGAGSVQRMVEDFLPLILLFAVSITGLMLTASYSWMDGYAFSFIAILHAITVIATFVWLPFGKFFHIFQRPAQLGVGFYKDLGRREELAQCRRCGHPFTSRVHVEDLIAVEKALGYRYEVGNARLEHYQWVCPPCRRASFAMAQALTWSNLRGGRVLEVPSALPMPVSANPGLGEGPLGEEDSENFHP